MQVSVKIFISNTGITTPIAAFVRQQVLSAVRTVIKRAPKVTEMIPLPPDRFSSASTDATLGKKSKARRSYQKRRNHEY